MVRIKIGCNKDCLLSLWQKTINIWAYIKNRYYCGLMCLWGAVIINLKISNDSVATIFCHLLYLVFKGPLPRIALFFFDLQKWQNYFINGVLLVLTGILYHKTPLPCLTACLVVLFPSRMKNQQKITFSLVAFPNSNHKYQVDVEKYN